jgi:peptidylprolyl isomerase
VTQLHLVATALVAVALTASACGTGTRRETSLQDQVQVTGAFKARPTLRFKAPLSIEKSESWVTQVGRGDRVGAASTVILQLTITNGRTGKPAVSTLDKGQRPLDIRLGNQVFPSLAQALVGQRDHSRVVVASTPEDAYGSNGAPQVGLEADDPVLMVADILSTDPTTVLTSPTGATGTPPATAPRLVLADGVPARFDFTGARKPRKLVVIALREGTGPVVESPDRVAVDYLLQVWGAPEPVQETFSKEPTLISIGTSSGAIKAWDTALVGAKEGSRLLILAPPELAYGATAQQDIPSGSTLAFVVDVLGVG